MSRAAAVFILTLACVGKPASDVELLQAAKSPVDLARYLESHKNFAWQPLWQALGLTDAPILPCVESWQCATESIKILAPPQTVLAIELPAGAVVYVRFFGNERAGWRRAGAALATLKNYPRRHLITWVGAKPFFRFSTQGASGSDIASEIEPWIDLTRQEFKPVFAFSPEGRQNRMGFGVSRVIRATAHPKVVGQLETIEVDLELRYLGPEELYRTRYIATYQRPRNQQEFALRNVKAETANATAVSNHEFVELTDMVDGPANEQLLRYALPGLRTLATSGKRTAKDWLRAVLGNCKDTNEKRLLLDLLRNQ